MTTQDRILLGERRKELWLFPRSSITNLQARERYAHQLLKETPSPTYTSSGTPEGELQLKNNVILYWDNLADQGFNKRYLLTVGAVQCRLARRKEILQSIQTENRIEIYNSDPSLCRILQRRQKFAACHYILDRLIIQVL